MSHQAKILFFDLEVSRAIVAGYGNKWEFKVVKFLQHQKLMCYAYKFQGDKKITFIHMHQFKTYRDFVQSLADVLSEADIVVAHNLKRFDEPMSNTFFVTEGIKPPTPYKTVDTLLVARRVFKFPSNSLNDLAEHLGIGSKLSITYADLEDDFMSAKPKRKTIKLMDEYNRKDVEILERLYDIELPHMKNHPNVAVYGDGSGCPACGHPKFWTERGLRVTSTMRYKSLRCKKCDTPYRERLADKDFQARPTFVK